MINNSGDTDWQWTDQPPAFNGKSQFQYGIMNGSERNGWKLCATGEQINEQMDGQMPFQHSLGRQQGTVMLCINTVFTYDLCSSKEI